MRSAAVLSTFILVHSLTAAEQLNPAVLNAAKDATAYITAGNASGSGFLTRVTGRSGWLVTNAHIVTSAVQLRQSVTVVLGSGSAKERSLAAQVVGYDENRDLAILRVEGEDLPKPLASHGNAKIQETMPVWVVGFPFGDALAVGAANPAPTITATQISSIRANPLGVVEVIQTAGGINVGNSGGPIINDRGAVIGIAVAKVVGTEIGFAIPSTFLEDTLAGRIAFSETVMTVPTAGTAKIDFTAFCVDPLDNITKVVALVTPSSLVIGKLKFDEKGRVAGPIASGMTVVPLTYENRVAKGTAAVRLPKGAAQEVVVQFRFHRKQGAPLFTNDVRARPGGTPPAPPAADARIARAPAQPDARGPEDRIASAPPRPDGRSAKVRKPVVTYSWLPPQVNVITPSAETAVEGPIERDASGRRYTALTAMGVTLDLGKDLLQVVSCPTGNVVYAIHRDEPTVSVVDPLTWKTVDEILVPESPVSIWADATLIAVACGKSRRVALVDPEKRSIIASGTLPELRDYTPDTVIGRAPDGSVMTLWKHDHQQGKRMLVHVTTTRRTQIMINGDDGGIGGMFWASWLPDGTGLLAQYHFALTPAGRLSLAFPQDPISHELRDNRLFGRDWSIRDDSGRAFLTADHKSLVLPRYRVKDWADPSPPPPDELLDERRAPNKFGLELPWTYLISPTFDTIFGGFPGAAIVELPERQLFITAGTLGTSGSPQPVCYYVSSTDGRVVREITLAWSKTDNQLPYWGRYSGAVFVPGHELLLVPSQDWAFRNLNWAKKLQITYTAFRCGPVKNGDVQAGTSNAPTNDPPPIATVGKELRYTPMLETRVAATEFRLKRALPGMTIDPKTGDFTWRPGKEHVGRWPITILATVDSKETTVITWTLEVR